MENGRLDQAKKYYDELTEVTVRLNEAYALQYKYPGNQELKQIALDLQQKAYKLEEEFKEKFKDLLDAGHRFEI
jgi:hypothetical protein